MLYLQPIYKNMDDNYNKGLAKNTKSLLYEIVEKPKREGLFKNPERVTIVIKAQHLCMQMRGVAKQNSFASTSSMVGQFRKSSETRAEFLSIIGK